MELYRTETYKQLQVLNLLDVVIVSKRKIYSIDIFFLNDSFGLVFFFSYLNIKEGGQGTEFLKRLQEIENNEQQQQDNFNQEVDILQCIYIHMCCTNSIYIVTNCVISIIHLIVCLIRSTLKKSIHFKKYFSF
jgi:hypothetical protein